MSRRARAPRVSVEAFEEKYELSADPWDYATSPYERQKYADTLAVLQTRSFNRALEVGCSIGIFTEKLARRCDQLVAIDFSKRAVQLARKRVGRLAGVEVMQSSFPEQVPPGEWDLVVCSEVLYYLDSDALLRALEWLSEQLASGAMVLAASWRGQGVEEPHAGDDVHDLLAAKLARWHALDDRRPGYRLDRFDGDAG